MPATAHPATLHLRAEPVACAPALLCHSQLRGAHHAWHLQANRTIVTAYAASQQQHGSAVGSDAAVATGGAGASGGAPVAVPASQVAVDEAYGDLHLMSDLAITFCHADPVVAVAVAEHALLTGASCTGVRTTASLAPLHLTGLACVRGGGCWTGLLRLLRPVVPSLVEQPRYAEVLVKLLRVRTGCRCRAALGVCVGRGRLAAQDSSCLTHHRVRCLPHSLTTRRSST